MSQLRFIFVFYIYVYAILFYMVLLLSIIELSPSALTVVKHDATLADDMSVDVNVFVVGIYTSLSVCVTFYICMHILLLRLLTFDLM